MVQQSRLCSCFTSDQKQNMFEDLLQIKTHCQNDYNDAGSFQMTAINLRVILLVLSLSFQKEIPDWVHPHMIDAFSSL
jgi:hypothetical protein